MLFWSFNTIIVRCGMVDTAGVIFDVGCDVVHLITPIWCMESIISVFGRMEKGYEYPQIYYGRRRIHGPLSLSLSLLESYCMVSR